MYFCLIQKENGNCTKLGEKYTKDLVTEFVSYGVNCLELDGLFIWVK